MAVRCTAVVSPAWRKIDAASGRPNQGACCRTYRELQASRATIACSTGETVEFAQDGTPCTESLVLVPIESIDERILY
ncbi:hypothetical protein GGQ65_005046 [Rhizobium fabae]|uniref:Uncharacterized protein n=1 Tax=Rhizobium fabae TaxID=573179 RepID=A0A7W6B8J5_9HYPH|nr:hypothetical protein [Rhizobium fabae]